MNSPTTFTLTVSRTGCSGVETLTRQVTINTTPSPTATFAANPSDIELGNNTTLQWSTTDASTVTITPSPVAGSGMSGPQTVSASGSLTIRPTAINQSPGYTYTLTATSDGCSPQTITKTAVVIVRPVRSHQPAQTSYRSPPIHVCSAETAQRFDGMLPTRIS